MSNIVRAWKDETYRQGLSTNQQAMLPSNPAGEVELTDAELEVVYGAANSNTIRQDVDQKAHATFDSNNIVIDSQLCCSAANDADQDAEIG